MKTVRNGNDIRDRIIASETLLGIESIWLSWLSSASFNPTPNIQRFSM